MSSSLEGYIYVYRKIQEHWLWDNKEPFDKAHAWIDLIFMANFRDKKVLFGGNMILVKRGQRVTSLRHLSEKWNWSRHKVSDFLRALERDKMVTVERDSKKTLITIVNYDIYQSLKTESGTGSRDSKGTLKGQSGDSEGTLKGQSGTQENKRNKRKERNKKEKEKKEKEFFDPDVEDEDSEMTAEEWWDQLEDETPKEIKEKYGLL